jgi:predicted AAA+ superfamily ATPase
LLKLKDNYPKYLITTDREDYSQDGIIHMKVIEILKEAENIIL